jgi:hypothetical protein
MRAARLLGLTRIICTPIGISEDVLAESILKSPDSNDTDSNRPSDISKSVLADLATQCIGATIAAWKMGFSSPGLEVHLVLPEDFAWSHIFLSALEKLKGGNLTKMQALLESELTVLVSISKRF